MLKIQLLQQQEYEMFYIYSNSFKASNYRK